MALINPKLIGFPLINGHNLGDTMGLQQTSPCLFDIALKQVDLGQEATHLATAVPSL